MVRLRIKEILESKGKSKYWLWKQLGMSYSNYNAILEGHTSSIRFEILDKLATILEVPVGDLLEQISNNTEKK